MAVNSRCLVRVSSDSISNQGMRALEKEALAMPTFGPSQLLRDGPRSATPSPNQSSLGHSQSPTAQASSTGWRRLKPDGDGANCAGSQSRVWLFTDTL